MIAVIFLIFFKAYLLFNVGQTNDYFLHSYRAWTLTHYGRDEIGNALPVLFSGPAGQQRPLTSYLFVPFGGIGFEFLVWLLPAMLLAATFSSPSLGLIFLATPAFLWPGNYNAKLLVLFLVMALAAFKRKKFLILFMALLAVVSLLPRPNFFDSSSLITTINSLRGEHNFPLLAKVLHNKLYFVLAYLQNIFSTLNPSFLFGFGDKVQKIPPLLIVLLPFLFRRPPKLIGTLAVASLLLGSLFPFFLTLVILGGRHLPRVAIYLGVIILLPMAYFSAHFLPHGIWVNQSRGLAAVVDLAKANPGSPILLADDVYPDPGPYLAYRLHPAPPIPVQNTYQYRNFIRRIGHIEVVSPADPRLQAAGPISLVSRIPPPASFEPVVFDPFGQPVMFRLIYASSK